MEENCRYLNSLPIKYNCAEIRKQIDKNIRNDFPEDLQYRKTNKMAIFS